MKKSLKGSFTLEMALLSGVLFTLIEGMIISMFLFHDRVVIQEIGYAHLINYQIGKESDLYQGFLQESKERLLITQVTEVSLNSNRKADVLSYSFKTNYLFSQAITLLLSRKTKSTGSVSCAKNVDAPLLLRSIHGLLKD